MQKCSDMSSATNPASLTNVKYRKEHRIFYILSQTFLNSVYSVDMTAGQPRQMPRAKEQSLYINLSPIIFILHSNRRLNTTTLNWKVYSSFYLQSINLLRLFLMWGQETMISLLAWNLALEMSFQVQQTKCHRI